MKGNNKKNLLTKLLNRLQEDSWQLELLVSGFTIFGLFYAFGPVQDAFNTALHENDTLKDVYQTALLAIIILIFNLILHVILRSIWIGALGLRYVSGEVEIDELNYNERFTKFLNKKVGSFDNYIEKLEKLCSIIFAISFLLIFYVAASFIVTHLIDFIGSLNLDNSSVLLWVLVNGIKILLYVGATLTFVDYITQGFLKKYRLIAAVYFPFYWVFSYLTLSFLYRPLYYNLIDNKFGRRVSMLLFPLYIVLLLLGNTYKEQSSFMFLHRTNSYNTFVSDGSNYENLIEKNNLFTSTLSIQSKIITDPYIKVKIPLSVAIEDHIAEFNESLKSVKDKSGYKSNFVEGIKTSYSLEINTDSLGLEYLKTFQDIYSFKIDSLPCKTDFLIVIEPSRRNRRFSFETYIGTNNLTEGKHMLVYSRYKHPDTDSVITIKEIPFWYYKD